jgi:2-polyprenyl-6-hydroxyphenyl methylase/3-demethylubiquinone-9 3-methyltransferase
MIRIAAIVLAAITIAGAAVMWTGSGRHRLDDPVQARTSATAPAYPYHDGAPSHPSSYIWPAVTARIGDLPSGTRILDLGCGSGALLASLEGRGWERVGLDISASGIEMARATHPEVTFVLGDATGDLTSVLEHGSFDVVISTETLEHVQLPRRFLSNAYDALKPGGRLVISVPYNGYLKTLAVALLGRGDQYYNAGWDWGHIKFFSVDSLAQLLWEAGFTGLEYEGVGRAPYFWKSMVFVATKPAAG